MGKNRFRLHVDDTGMYHIAVLFGGVTGVREGTIIAALLVGIVARYFNHKLTFLQKRLPDPIHL